MEYDPNNMKLHKIELYVADLNNDSSLEDVKDELDNRISEYFTVWIGKCKSKSIGEWSDNHPLNDTRININKWWDNK